VAVFALGLVIFSVVITWVLNHTRGSVLMAILLHASFNGSQALMGFLFPAAGSSEVGPLIAFGVTALVIAVATRGRLGYAPSGRGVGVGPGDEPNRTDRVPGRLTGETP
jgi:hypothetical protein